MADPGFCGGCVHASRLPPAVATVDRDQPWFTPWSASPRASGASLIAVRQAGVADVPPRAFADAASPPVQSTQLCLPASGRPSRRVGVRSPRTPASLIVMLKHRRGRSEQPDPPAAQRPDRSRRFYPRHAGPGYLPGVRLPGRSRGGVLPRPGIARGLRARGRSSRPLGDDLDPGTGCARRARPAHRGRSSGHPAASSRTLGLDRDVDRGPRRHPDRPGRSSRRLPPPQ